jgi:SNF2 family DNA or RNA helicase
MSDTAVLGADTIDSPPPGTLSTLWYSREVFLNLFVLEKIIGWKTRPVTKLEWKDENDVKLLDPVEALSISQKLLLDGNFWANRMKRMEVSRIHAAQCPVVLVAAAAKEGQKENPRYSLAPRKEEEREEVLLVKWRGRSHMHCSWERRKDLEKFDPSNNTAKNKIRRFFHGQEVAIGNDWKKVLENERVSNADPVEAQDGINEEEEFIPPQYLEVERILACDENEMDLNVMAKQRALNLRTEQEALRKREEEDAKQKASEQAGETIHHTHKAHRLFDDLPVITDGDPPWDPEDNVRYVVKWKGLQYAEMTWEYWREIKRDAVDEAEDFWDRQKAPSLEEVERISNRPHPLVRDFRKLINSPEFAISHRPRPVAELGDGFKEDDEEDKEPSEGFQLRSYQLEGVNWLLFNWFNRRSCILADGKEACALCG